MIWILFFLAVFAAYIQLFFFIILVLDLIRYYYMVYNVQSLFCSCWVFLNFFSKKMILNGGLK